MLRRDVRDQVRLKVPGRVAYLRTNLSFGLKAGGSVGHVAGVVNALGRRCEVVAAFSADSLPLLDPGLKVQIVRTPSPLGYPHELNYYAYQRKFVREVRAAIAKLKPDLIYHRHSLASYAAVRLARDVRVPLVVEYNGSEVWIAEHWGRSLRYRELAAMAEAVLLRHAHVVVTVSDVLREHLVERGVEPKRILTYPNCIDPAMFDPSRFSEDDRLTVRKSSTLEKDDLVVTFVGTFGKWHGARVFARAIRYMVEADPGWLTRHRVRFLFVGDGLEMPQVREILSSERVMEFVRFAGLVPQAETPRYLAASDILVSPHVPNADGSRFFGSPTKLFEYMAMAKGIVASDLEQIGQVLRDSLRIPDLPSAAEPKGERLAVLVRPDDEKELVEGIRFLVERPDWRRHLGENARREVLARYTWDHHVNAILEGLHTVVGLERVRSET